MNSFVKAYLTDFKSLDLMIFSSNKFEDNFTIKLFDENSFVQELRIVKKVSNLNIYIYKCEFDKLLDLSKMYYLSFGPYDRIILDISNIVNFPLFDEFYEYKGNDLGATYSKKGTTFKLWAPTTTKCFVKYIFDNKIQFQSMEREENGIFSCTIREDLKNCSYKYVLLNNGLKVETNDPYGKGTSLNSEYSAVIDFDELENIKTVPLKSSTSNLCDCIIYETNVRDFTEDLNSDIEKKGKYLGFVEKGKKTKQGNPAGLDYLIDLGITHVQLQPILDFRGVDDIKCFKSYNWGYDPISFFALEGSYSSNPENPISRLIEFKTMVNELHNNGIGVIMDVVYNHIYDYPTSVFEKSVPGYFFRKKKNGEAWSTSGCGNDFASEKCHVQKMIIDSLVYLTKTFGIDGFRFDLMGILDLQMMLKIEKELRKINPNILLYGEGWNIPDDIPASNKATADNAFILKGYGFFNDTYRDLIKGSSQKGNICEQGYINGCPHYFYGMDYIFHGSCAKRSYDPRFFSANQSINYFECHDNATMFDKLCHSNANLNDNDKFKIISFANDILISSFGCPLIHMGQEIGLSKNDNENTYNVPIVNNMRWNEVDDRYEMIESLKKAILRRKHLKTLYSLKYSDEINDVFKMTHTPSGLMILTSVHQIDGYKKMMIVFNPNEYDISYELDDYYYKLESDNFVDLAIKNANISGKSLTFFIKK